MFSILLDLFERRQQVVRRAASDDVLPSLLSGANVAGFIKVADAMKAQGDWW